jgi:hypothetical protein
MSDRRAGWVLVIVSGALGLMVALLAYQARPSAPFAAPTPLEGALSALGSAWPGVVMVVAIAVVGFIVSRNALIRALAAVVGVGTVVAVLIIGGSAAFSAPFDGSHTVDCTDSNPGSDPEIQAAVDELSHPGPVDLIVWSPDSCGAIVRGIPAKEAFVLYAHQLADAGWTIETSDGSRLVARRDGYTFLLFSCGQELALEVRLDTSTAVEWC